ncbi:hypothetical protein H696_02521 [Fonticula alba]|uniref:Fatty acid hydroxylase domain-containing protein n=1 Tax=Fonticula alba TaxID=691883 RepID=A0A058ZDP1_FONAL|nr:hypothetical protein H696_02521 [Fonticula alba]KCV71582.1 hypothetical protein H696_02521 [Fonticula alba]|eukprot:XP_009494705.1 hypothetical protein H696_02521 [Fonticula alba]
MDIVVLLGDEYLLRPLLYEPLIELTGFTPLADQLYFPRLAFSTWLLLTLGAIVMYLITSTISYLIFFVWLRDKYYPETAEQPFPGQEKLEIQMALWSCPWIGVLTAPFVFLEVWGYSRLYENLSDYPLWYIPVQIILFIFFTDTGIYWIHRLEHDIPFLYKYVHKPHHIWKVPTPFAALAFHPVDGWLQSTPYHIAVFLFPVHKHVYLGLFVFVQLWTIMIHDGVDFSPFDFINGSAHHTHHHLRFVYNYGQFFTFWDRLCGTHLHPNDLPPLEKKRLEKQRQLAAEQAKSSAVASGEATTTAAAAAKKSN